MEEEAAPVIPYSPASPDAKFGGGEEEDFGPSPRGMPQHSSCPPFCPMLTYSGISRPEVRPPEMRAVYTMRGAPIQPQPLRLLQERAGEGGMRPLMTPEQGGPVFKAPATPGTLEEAEALDNASKGRIKRRSKLIQKVSHLHLAYFKSSRTPDWRCVKCYKDIKEDWEFTFLDCVGQTIGLRTPPCPGQCQENPFVLEKLFKFPACSGFPLASGGNTAGPSVPASSCLVLSAVSFYMPFS